MINYDKLNEETITDLETELTAQKAKLQRLKQPRTVRITCLKIDALEAALARRMAMYATCLGLSAADIEALKIDPNKPISIVKTK